ncbi:MAG: pyridoxamine 5'-phosphate oxidase [Burkholderiales bacterium]|nr:pyridoxamine 5'-phosphate oxidase [Burkholderiales bacterium]
MTNLADLRKTYSQGSLSEEDIAQNPILQFQSWFEQASTAKCPEPHAMTLATISSNGLPSARIVLLKGITEDSFIFYTNYTSQKGHEIANNPNVALLFFWHELERQVRIEGVASQLDTSRSDAYYHSRPIESRIGAWASPQSQIIPNREFLVTQEDQFKELYGSSPPRPTHWGGYEVKANKIEFWQGRPSRLHDRIAFSFHENSWHMSRLAP